MIDLVNLYSIQYETCKVREHLKKISNNSEQNRRIES